MKGSLPDPSKEVGMNMASFLPELVETGWEHATVFLGRRRDWPQPSFSLPF